MPFESSFRPGTPDTLSPLQGPSVIFIDEIDALAGGKNVPGGTHRAMDPNLMQLYMELNPL